METWKGAVVLAYNIQRETLLYSEKARAYRMKYEAMKHQGKKCGKSTLDKVGEAAGESGKTVQRYIWLSRLSDELLELVDKEKIKFIQGVDISFLNETEQEWVRVILEETGGGITTDQSCKLKKYSQEKELTLSLVREILSAKKTKERKITIKSEKINRFFSDDYSNEEIEKVIIQLLEEWQSKQ